MKKFIKLFGGLLMIFTMCLTALGQGSIQSVFNASATGTTSATVFVGEGVSSANITDLSWRLDSNVTTGTIGFRIGEKRFPVTSATAAAGSVVYISNTNTGIAVSEYVIFESNSGGNYVLRRVTAAATTSITVDTAITPAITTSDNVYSTLTTVEKPVPNTTSATAAHNIWLPANMPTAVTIDGNTTSCRISISGVRSQYK